MLINTVKLVQVYLSMLNFERYFFINKNDVRDNITKTPSYLFNN